MLFDPSLKKVYLKPGELLKTDEPCLVITVLGSCISVTMFHRQTGNAAMCHAMLPYGRENTSFKYVDIVLPHMVDYFKKKNIKASAIEVKLFGGADMFQSAKSDYDSKKVGRVNIKVAKEYLHQFGLSPVAMDVEGKKGRKLIFTTQDGTVFIEKKSRLEYYTIEKS